MRQINRHVGLFAIQACKINGNLSNYPGQTDIPRCEGWVFLSSPKAGELLYYYYNYFNKQTAFILHQNSSVALTGFQRFITFLWCLRQRQLRRGASRITEERGCLPNVQRRAAKSRSPRSRRKFIRLRIYSLAAKPYEKGKFCQLSCPLVAWCGKVCPKQSPGRWLWGTE